jgi:type I restriction enzyme R subunit
MNEDQRKDAVTPGRKEETESFAPSRPRAFALNESVVEDVAVVYFGAIGAATKRGVEIDDAGERTGPSEVVLKGRLGAALHRLNPNLPHDTVEEVVRILSRPPHPTLIQNNRWFDALLTDGVEVEYRDARIGDGTGETRGGRVRLVDFEHPEKNDLLVVRQLSVAGASASMHDAKGALALRIVLSKITQ